jgi:hypothetical protein
VSAPRLRASVGSSVAESRHAASTRRRPNRLAISIASDAASHAGPTAAPVSQREPT